MKDSGFANTTVRVHAALRACSNLDELEVKWAFSERDDEDENTQTATVHGIDIPTVETVNPEVFGDDFCDAVATYCPRLRDFMLLEADEDRASNRTIRSFTDRGPRSLSTMPWLSEATIHGVNITGSGLYALVIEHNAKERSASRRYHIMVGEAVTDTPDLTFYEASQEFLRRILDCDGELPCEHRNVLLQLRNRSRASIDRMGSAQVISETKTMIEQIKERHPTACVTLTTVDYDEGSCSRIEEFTFTIGPKVLTVGVYDAEEQIDDVIYNRVPNTEDELESESGMFEDSDEPPHMTVLGYMQEFVNAHTEDEDDPVYLAMQQFMNSHARRAAEEEEEEEEDDEDSGDGDDDDDEEDEEDDDDLPA